MDPMLLMMIPLFAAMYFFMIRPQQKQKKKDAEMRNSLQVGSEITTIGGIVGKVIRVQDDFITFETGEDRVRIKTTRWAVRAVGKATEEPQDQGTLQQ